MEPETIYIVDPVSLSRMAPVLPRDALRVAMLFDGHRRLWEVVRDSYLSGRMTMSVCGRLSSLGVLQSATDHTAEPAGEVLYEATPEPAQVAIQPAPAPVAPPVLDACDESLEEVITLRLPKMVVRPPVDDPDAPVPRAEADSSLVSAPTLRVDSGTIPALATEESLHKTPAEAPQAEPRVPSPAFDATDETFFDSYEPEDDGVDSFWDLESTPYAQAKARKRAERRQRGGWFRQLLSMF